MSTNTLCDKAIVKAMAAFDAAQYPQYKGYWDGPEWKSVQITRRIRGKGGVYFEAGDFTIARKHGIIECGPFEGQDSFTAYSWRYKLNVALRPKDFKWLE